MAGSARTRLGTWLMPAHNRLRARRVTPGRGDRRALARLATVADPGGEPLTIPAVQLGGAAVTLRPGTSDGGTAMSTFAEGFHLPPYPLPDAPVVWDLGANIGLTAADFVARLGAARVVALEPHNPNAELARRNTAAFPQVEVIEAAAWTRDGEVRFSAEPGREDQGRVDERGGSTVAAISLDTLLERYGAPDYVKLDVEGAERALLRAGGAWAEAAGVIGVECHGGYSMHECAADLQALGFETELLPHTLRRRANETVFARRAGAPRPDSPRSR